MDLKKNLTLNHLVAKCLGLPPNNWAISLGYWHWSKRNKNVLLLLTCCLMRTDCELRSVWQVF